MADGMAAESQELLARRALGRSGLTVTRLMLGGGPIGGLFASVDGDTAQATLQAAWSAGVRAFDTAPHYGAGLSELRFGEFLAARPRAEYVLSTKVGRLLVPSGAAPGDAEGFHGAPRLARVRDYSPDGVGRPWRPACGGSASTALTWRSSTTRMTTLRRPSRAPTRRWRSSDRRASSARSASA